MNWLCTWFALSCLPGVIAGPASVVDGDTLSIGGQAIRLSGIDAEEIYEPYGLHAAATLRGLTAGRIVTCRPEGTSYRRLVAICFVEGKDLGEAMVRLGAALDCTHYSGGKYRSLEPPGIRAKLLQKGYC